MNRFVRGLFKYRVKILLAALIVVFMFCLWAFVIWNEDISALLAASGKRLRESVFNINDFPMFFYALAVFLLPLFFLPVTPVYFLASARAADAGTFMVVLSYCYLGVMANMVVSYLFARRFGRFVGGRLQRRGVSVPRVPRYEQYEFTFLIRVIPGNPLAVQNYVLGLADIPFDRYILMSTPLQFIQIAAYVYFGEGVFEGGASKIFLGMSVLGVLAVSAAMLKKAYGHKLRINAASKRGEQKGIR